MWNARFYRLSFQHITAATILWAFVPHIAMPDAVAEIALSVERDEYESGGDEAMPAGSVQLSAA
jgi:hypothetical protein